MKKGLIIVVNVLIAVAMLAYVVVYSVTERRTGEAARVESFESMTVAMEQVTNNYLSGEQRICDAWAGYINSNELSIEQAIEYLRQAQPEADSMAHILYIDDESLSGMSTVARVNAPDDYAVDYSALKVSFNPNAADDATGVNVTRGYTNPINAVQSIAFYDRIRLTDDGDGSLRDALLLRVIPLDTFSKEWVFPTEEYDSAEISMIDMNGDYIIKSRSFKNSNFFEFYKSYNETDLAQIEALKTVTLTTTGTFDMLNSRGQLCLIAHTPVNAASDWAIVSYIPRSELKVSGNNYMLIGIVTAGLILLFVFDLLIMLYYNRRLSAAAAEAESANQAKTSFLSTMSHDIRTPMNAIIGLTTIASKNVNDPVAVNDSLKKIQLASNHLLTLINDILDISKVESGRLNLTPVTFPIEECAENLVNISHPMVKEKNIDFNFRVSHVDVEYLHADQLRINQIFINLLSNAIKYTEPGGRVTVDMWEEQSPITGRVRLIYRVADSGIGMTPEFMARMYEPFSRQTDSRVNTIQGTGLGLAITKQMIDLMGGDIRCDSKVGEGTTFTVTLDIPTADRAPDELALKPLSVLIVDDDPVSRETALDTLRSLGLNGSTAASGIEAVCAINDMKASGEKCDVVILDWRMPDMDGVETARHIRETADPDVPILIISAYDWTEIEDAARDAGVNGFISKPLFRSTLYDKLNTLFGTGGEERESESDNSDIEGMNILVAEDNDINWEIISAMLMMLGIKSERAENGQIAVERIESAAPGEFDLIFMDIQMPVMNGLDATRAIRGLTNPAARDIPIIAMTADAFSENVAECLAAGMNGHIAKPVDMKLVIKEIRRIKEAAW